MIVAMNLWHVIAVSTVAMLLCGFIGYANGQKAGYVRGWVDAFRIKENMEASNESTD